MHYKRLNGLKRDFRKKVACEVVRKAREHGVDVLVCENLQHFNPDAANDSQSNELLMIWGHGEIGKWLKHFTEQYGISYLDVNPRLTSQTDPQTGFIGIRDKFDSRKLYVRRNGETVTIHANLAAAQNIAALAQSCFSSAAWILARKISGGYTLWWEESDEKKNSAKKQDLKLRFGAYKLMVVNGQIQRLPKNAEPTGPPVYLYRYEDGWWSKEERHARTK